MAKIVVEKAHTLGLEEGKKRAKELLEKFAQKLSHMIKEHKWDDAAGKGTAKGGMFTAEFGVTENKVTVNIELGILASAMKGQIETGVREAVDKKFA